MTVARYTPPELKPAEYADGTPVAVGDKVCVVQSLIDKEQWASLYMGVTGTVICTTGPHVSQIVQSVLVSWPKQGLHGEWDATFLRRVMPAPEALSPADTWLALKAEISRRICQIHRAALAALKPQLTPEGEIVASAGLRVQRVYTGNSST